MRRKSGDRSARRLLNKSFEDNSELVNQLEKDRELLNLLRSEKNQAQEEVWNIKAVKDQEIIDLRNTLKGSQEESWNVRSLKDQEISDLR